MVLDHDQELSRSRVCEIVFEIRPHGIDCQHHACPVRCRVLIRFARLRTHPMEDGWGRPLTETAHTPQRSATARQPYRESLDPERRCLIILDGRLRQWIPTRVAPVCSNTLDTPMLDDVMMTTCDPGCIPGRLRARVGGEVANSPGYKPILLGSILSLKK